MSCYLLPVFSSFKLERLLSVGKLFGAFLVPPNLLKSGGIISVDFNLAALREIDGTGGLRFYSVVHNSIMVSVTVAIFVATTSGLPKCHGQPLFLGLFLDFILTAIPTKVFVGGFPHAALADI
jgi:hypothetical protein